MHHVVVAQLAGRSFPVHSGEAGEAERRSSTAELTAPAETTNTLALIRMVRPDMCFGPTTPRAVAAGHQALNPGIEQQPDVAALHSRDDGPVLGVALLAGRDGDPSEVVSARRSSRVERFIPFDM